MSEKSKAELLFKTHLKELGVNFIEQCRFHPARKWKFDFVIFKGNGFTYGVEKIAIEIDGYFKGRHGVGWGADNEKRNTGTMMGYRVLVFSTKDVYNGTAKAFLEEAFNGTKA